MTTILFVFRWYQIGHAVVHYYVSVLGMLSHWKPKYRRYVILCCLVVLIFYPWLNRGLPQTIVLPLPTSRIHLRITLFITCQDPLAEEVDLLLSHTKSFMFPEIRLYFFFVRTFWFSYHLWFKVFRLVTVYRPPPSKKNGFTVERFFSEFSALSEDLTVTFCQFLLCGDFNFPVDVDSNANCQKILWPFFSADMRAHRDHILELVTEMWKSRLCCQMHPNVGGSCIGALWPWVSYGIDGWRHSIWFGCRYNARLSQWKLSLHCLRVTNSEGTQRSIQLQHQICSIEAKCSGWCVITTPLPSAFNEEDAIYRVEERLVHSLAITHKEIRYTTRVDPVLSSALEFVKQGWAQHVEDLRLQPFFNRRLKLSVEQDCLLWGPRVIKPTRF